jgi:hypothetical protein
MNDRERRKILDELYPGSKRKIQEQKAKEEHEGWQSKAKSYTVQGVDVDFYTVGQLAEALNRRPVTIRKWEREGIIPRSLFSAPSKDPRGRRRLYTRAQIQGMVDIAREEGILHDPSKHITKTLFTLRVTDLFKRLGLDDE